jgi:tryptophanyl-tRNA synthetase
LATGTDGKKKRVVSGMRPTGRLHIGHYFGALQNWVRLQNDPDYDSFHFVADWHALTSDYADTSAIAENTLQIAIDFLAAGLDPQKSVIFQQSLIPEHAELHLLLSMVTPLGWLERVPTYKEALENVKDKDLHNYGFLGYPVLQCADIVIYSENGMSLVVPVGEDQVSHVELSREIVRRFGEYNGLRVDERLREAGHAQDLAVVYRRLLRPTAIPFTPTPDQYPLSEEEWAGVVRMIRSRVLEIGWSNALELLGDRANLVKFVEVLSEPEAMLTRTPRIPGLDGRKMSKSYGNTITLSENDADIRAKTKVMKTDPQRQKRTDRGNPDVCPVYDWHKLFSAEEPGRLEWVRQGCTTAGIGCIECKAAMADNLIKWIAPIRERRLEYEKHPARALEILDQGSKKARRVAQGTMERVREAVFGWDKKRKEISGGGTAANA